MSVNTVILLGNLGDDPRLTSTASGRSILRFPLAVDTTNYSFDSDGNTTRRKRTDWFTIIAWGSMAETNYKYLQKGAQVCVSGTLRSRTWTEQDGTRKNIIEIHADMPDGIKWLKGVRTADEAESVVM